MELLIHSLLFQYLFYSKSLIKKRQKDPTILFLQKPKSNSLARILGEDKIICLSVTYIVILTKEIK